MLFTSKYLIPCAYFGPIGYFAHIAQKECCIEVCDYFTKQSIRNRCRIYGANGTLLLTVPKIRKNSSKTIFKDLRISYDWNWQKEHWQSIVSAYRASPYFEYYEDELYCLIHTKYQFLIDLNLEVSQFICSKLGLTKKLIVSEKYEATSSFIDLRNHTFEQERLNQYEQVFENKHGFLANLSILDLFLNEGKNSKAYLESIQL